MRSIPDYCRSGDCRFSDGYDSTFELAPPAGMRHPEALFAFGSHARLRYDHFGKHFSLEGDDVVYRLQLAWDTAGLTVVREDSTALMWVVDHKAFEDPFGGPRVTLVSRRCSDRKPPERRCCNACPEKEPRPERMTLRSVQQWAPIVCWHILYPNGQPDAVREVMLFQPDRWIGKQFRIVPGSKIVADPDTPFGYQVRIVTESKNVATLVIADAAQRALIEADPVAFAASHVVWFRNRAPSGWLEAYFLPISP